MQTEHRIIQQVITAKSDSLAADDLIQSYIPFILAEASKTIGKKCTDADDEFSIGMIAFHEAILGFSRDKGAFLPYASMLIKNRIIDYHRKERRHLGLISLQESEDEESDTLLDRIADPKNTIEERINLNATQQEIEELSKVMADFGVSFVDVADNAPKQERTMEACKLAIRYAIEHPQLLDDLLQSKKLPLAALVNGSMVERKTLERHRKYILVMLLIQTNGYEIIRGHLQHSLKSRTDTMSMQCRKGGNRE